MINSTVSAGALPIDRPAVASARIGAATGSAMMRRGSELGLASEAAPACLCDGVTEGLGEDGRLTAWDVPAFAVWTTTDRRMSWPACGALEPAGAGAIPAGAEEGL